jgi:hypothetical protein
MNKKIFLLTFLCFLTACTNQNSNNHKSDHPDISLNAGVGVVTGSGDFGSMVPSFIYLGHNIN